MTTVDTDRLLELADASPEAMYALFEEHGWGDGLPLVPPTRERVDAMLELAEGDPDEELAVLPPRAGVVTRRMVAVNAVLAGCPPEVFPVVLTAARALAHPDINLRGVNATTHPVAPLLIVSGAAVREGGFNAGVGAFGPGNRANATVGRAVRLILLHVAGAAPGFGDASSQGQPAKYTYCVAENLDECPWESYPASVGVDAPSAVTVHCGEGPHNVHDMEAEGRPELMLDKMASAMTSLGMNNACISMGQFFIGLGPEHARTFALHGMVRSDIAGYLFNKARLPARVFRRHFEERAWDEWMKLAADDDLLPMTGHPDNIRVFVVGGPGKHSSLIPSWGMTKSVTLPQVDGGGTDDDDDLPTRRRRRPGAPRWRRRPPRSPACASRCSTTASPTPRCS